MTSMEIQAVFNELRYRRRVKSQADFGRAVGWGRAFASLVLNGKEKPPAGTLNKVKEAFSDIDIDALLGEAGVARESAPDFKTHRQKEKPEKRVPFFDAEADAGDMDGDMLPVSSPSGYIDTGDLFGPCEAAIRIRGNSMLKAYPSGTILGLNRHYDSFIQPGELYVLETRSQRIFKRLFDCEGERKDCFECYSDNDGIYKEGPRAGKPFYPVFYVPKEEVLRTWAVVGSARPHGNSLIIHANP